MIGGHASNIIYRVTAVETEEGEKEKVLGKEGFLKLIHVWQIEQGLL